MTAPYGGGPATLMQRDGQTPVGPIQPGVEVTISAWLPHREGTRYLVSEVNGPELGWLMTGNLQAQPRPVAPKPLVPVVVAKPKPKPRERKKAAASPAVAAPAPVAAKSR